MLNSLRISNFALIEQLHLEFDSGLNIITGETGAGKSILIGAIQLLLGDRARSGLLRQGADKLYVEGEFSAPSDMDLLSLSEDFDLWDNTLLLRREINAAGRSRCFINDTPVTLATLSMVGDILVDLHGQHDHQSLLKSAYHGKYLDAFGVDDAYLQQMQQTYKTYKAALERYETFVAQEAELDQKRDFLAFQLKEIDDVNPQPDEETDLLHDEKVMTSSEKIFDLSQRLNRELYDKEAAVTSLLSRFEQDFDRLTGVDARFADWSGQCASARIQLEDLVAELQSFASGIDHDPARLEEIRRRLSELTRLKKKYGGAINDVLALRQRLSEQLTQIENSESTIQELKAELDDSLLQMEKAARVLSELRTAASERLIADTTKILEQLGFAQSYMDVRITPRLSQTGPLERDGQRVMVDGTGWDRIQFYISLNPGQPAMPLEQVASGGEISRIMLALKSALANADKTPVLIFDEIDSGISGRIGRVVGKRLEALSESHQILCITHLPQIASLGSAHYQVSKITATDDTVTKIVKLEDEARVEEVAKLLAGESLTQQALDSARELLEEVS